MSLYKNIYTSSNNSLILKLPKILDDKTNYLDLLALEIMVTIMPLITLSGQ